MSRRFSPVAPLLVLGGAFALALIGGAERSEGAADEGREVDVDGIRIAKLDTPTAPAGNGAHPVPSAGSSSAVTGAFDCVIEPSARVAIGAAVPGVLDAIFAERGDRIEAGGELARLESKVELAEVAVARARAARTDERRARDLERGLGERRKTRSDRMFARRAISAETLDDHETTALLAKIQLERAREEEEIARLERARAEKALERRILRSPIAGVVVERFKAVGERVDDEPVFELARLDTLHVEVIVPAGSFGSIHPGMRASITPAAPADGRYEGEVAVVDRVLDAASGTFGVRVVLPNPDERIPSGLQCQVRFEGH